MGKISQFTSPDEDTSKKIIIGDLILIQPFADLGFDTLAKQVALYGGWDLERVTADSHGDSIILRATSLRAAYVIMAQESFDPLKSFKSVLPYMKAIAASFLHCRC